MPAGGKRLNYFQGIAWFLMSLVICVSNDVLMKFLSREYAIGQILCLRYAFATAFLVAVSPTRVNLVKFTKRVPRLHVVRAIFLLSAMALYCRGLSRLPIAAVDSLNSVIPMFTLIFAHAFLREKIGKGNMIATILGFVGSLVVCEPTNAQFNTSAAVTLLASSALFAGLDVINKKFVSSEGVSPMVFYTAALTFVFSLPLAVFWWVWPSPTDICLFAALGAGANLLLHCLLKTFEKVDVSAVASLRYVELVLAALAGFAVFGEVPSKSTVVGSLIIISSTLYIVLSATVPRVEKGSIRETKERELAGAKSPTEETWG
jgi:drug/metabolite transporter (DMT)-like permease